MIAATGRTGVAALASPRTGQLPHRAPTLEFNGKRASASAPDRLARRVLAFWESARRDPLIVGRCSLSRSPKGSRPRQPSWAVQIAGLERFVSGGSACNVPASTNRESDDLKPDADVVATVQSNVVANRDVRLP